jgi:circadian clock protein KaiB
MKYYLKLYIAGQTLRSQRAVANLEQICEQELPGQYELVIIDVLERPYLAEEDKILATPTLIKQVPPPRRRIVGDLSQRDKVLFGLGLQPSEVYHERRGGEQR